MCAFESTFHNINFPSWVSLCCFRFPSSKAATLLPHTYILTSSFRLSIRLNNVILMTERVLCWQKTENTPELGSNSKFFETNKF
jgi:hypothetical protein